MGMGMDGDDSFMFPDEFQYHVDSGLADGVDEDDLSTGNHHSMHDTDHWTSGKYTYMPDREKKNMHNIHNMPPFHPVPSYNQDRARR